MFISYALIIIISYILGSIPFSYLMGVVFRSIDIRKHGSGNVGATNALRVLGWRLGLITLLLDMLKGLAAVIISSLIIPDNSIVLIIAGLSAIVGHIFTVFLRFKGGRGVATSAGVFAALLPIPFLIALLCFVIVTALSRYVSLGSIIGAVVLVVVQTIYTIKDGFGNIEYLILAVVVSLFIIVKHRANIQRLLQGKENKISFGNKERD